MSRAHEQDVVTVRELPATRFTAIGWLVLVLVVAATAAWEWRMRSLGLVAGDLDDTQETWAIQRERIASGDHDGVVILGGSRILFDTDLDVWEQMTGKRPVQLALPGMSGQRFLADIAFHSDFAGLVVIDVTPEQFFREGPGGNPQFEGVLDTWDDIGPARRAGHYIGQFLQRHVAFLEDRYTLTALIDQLEVPEREGVVAPYLRPWKLSEAYDDRQHVLWRQIERNERLRAHAIKVWMNVKRPAPTDAEIGKICAAVQASVAAIRARGGDVVFIRAPSTGAYLERENRKVPRATSWDRLLREAGTFGVHFEDYPEMRGLNLPELSHLSRASAARFTRAYVKVLIQHDPGLRENAKREPDT